MESVCLIYAFMSLKPPNPHPHFPSTVNRVLLFVERRGPKAECVEIWFKKKKGEKKAAIIKQAASYVYFLLISIIFIHFCNFKNSWQLTEMTEAYLLCQQQQQQITSLSDLPSSPLFQSLFCIFHL